MTEQRAREAIERIRKAADKREAGVQRDIARNNIGRAKLSDAEIEAEREHALVPYIRLDDLQAVLAALSTPFAESAKSPSDSVREALDCHGLDTPERVCFYEQDFYVLSNFSAFNVRWGPYTFQTAEHMYHWRRFFLAGGYFADALADKIMHAASAHDAFRVAQGNKAHQVEHWDDIKVGEMREILRLKAEQHEYVRRKLLATGDRELVENSWRDDFWGWGPNRDGQNMLGKLWMELRAALQSSEADNG